MITIITIHQVPVIIDENIIDVSANVAKIILPVLLEQGKVSVIETYSAGGRTEEPELIERIQIEPDTHPLVIAHGKFIRDCATVTIYLNE
jgi:hypothetical protein